MQGGNRDYAEVGIASDIRRAGRQESDPRAIHHIPPGGRTGERRRDGDERGKRFKVEIKQS